MAFFPVLDRFGALRESCVGNQSCRNFFYYRETRAIWRQTWRLILLANRRDEFRTCTIENWTVVGRGYFSHASSHSETVASALRVYVSKLKLNIYPWVIFRNNSWNRYCYNAAKAQGIPRDDILLHADNTDGTLLHLAVESGVAKVQKLIENKLHPTDNAILDLTWSQKYLLITPLLGYVNLGHFRAPKALTFKTRLFKIFLVKMNFICMPE